MLKLVKNTIQKSESSETKKSIVKKDNKKKITKQGDKTLFEKLANIDYALTEKN